MNTEANKRQDFRETAVFLSHLKAQNIRLWVEQDQLCFSAPKGVITPELRAKLVTHKEALIAFLREAQAATVPVSPIIPIPRDQEIPLSFAQERLWFLAQLLPHSPAYHLPLALRIEGPLDIFVLQQSLNDLCQRHEILRTTFPTIDGLPVQHIIPRQTCPLTLITLSSQESQDILPAIYQEIKRPFNLSEGPLIRVALLQESPDKHVLLVTLHHIIGDGWSLGTFTEELFALYTAHLAGQPSPLPSLALQYADFAVWQKQSLTKATLQPYLAYWRQQLQDLSPLLLPTRIPRPSVADQWGKTHHFTLSESITSATETLAQEENASSFMVLLAVFQLLLYRYTGQTDVAVGSPVSGRSSVETENLLGLFINTLVLRTSMADNPTFRTLLQRVRTTTLEGLANQAAPFEKLVEELQPARDLHTSPLFQVAFAFQNAPVPQLSVPGLQVSLMDLGEIGLKCDLELYIWTGISTGLKAFFVYSPALFLPETISRMAEHFTTLLSSVLAAPNGRISQMPLLNSAEHYQLLVSWNKTRKPYPPDLVHDLIEQQAKRHPSREAVRFGQESLTYQELNRRANQLACYLQSQGVKPETIVGICLPRSPEMIVSLLAILKAGGAYLPLDPAYPSERLAWMLEQCQPLLILTQSDLISALPPNGAQTLCLDTNPSWRTADPASMPQSGVVLDNLAYVIYTSGSTGKPKGVLVPHRGLCNVVQTQADVFQLTPGIRVLQFASLNFDGSIFEILTLCNGATLCLAPPHALGKELVQLLATEQIEAAVLTPSTLSTMPYHDLPYLEILGAAGEACPASLVQTWGQNRRFFNLYGPTEMTIWATAVHCKPDKQPPPIGRPIANTQVYLLDSHLQPVPVGVTGEMYLGGVGITRGYFHAPGATAAQFIPHPFSHEPGQRLYKTGDLARYRSDGKIEFIGRVDQQVKIRGFRVEPGEIEAALQKISAIRETVVNLWEDSSGQKELIAYIVGDPIPSEELYRQLQAKLPSYMLPTRFVFLEALPRSPSGKLHRPSLPAPRQLSTTTSKTYTAPRTPVERKLVQIWQELLQQEPVGIDHNFFELGGHSLLASRVIAQIREELGVDLPLAKLFENPTISALAQLVENATPVTPPLTIQKRFKGGKI